ncbi:hypothetical protein MTO96_041609 [Rhipicephalus appendiculatus]
MGLSKIGNVGKCGAPQAIDDRGQRWLWRCVKVNRRATVEQLTSQMNQGATNNVSQTTVQRTFLCLGLRKQMPGSCTYADCYPSVTKAGISTPVPQLDVH